MRDRRENILKRLVEIARGISGVTVYRNADDPTELKLPAIVIMDGEEEAQGLERPRYAFNDLVTMTPVICIVASGKDAKTPETISRLRIALRHAIQTDTSLRDETGSNGNIRYISSTTKDQWGAFLHGEERITYEFVYPILPSDFSPQGQLVKTLGSVSLD